MRAEAYIKRLMDDLDRWVQDGRIDENTAKALAADARAHFKSGGSTPILASLAGLVVGLGILTIIAANWSALTGVMRLGLVGVLISAAVLSAGYLRDRALNLPSNIVAAVGVLLCGGGVIVIGQLFHTSSTSVAFLSLWTGIALLLTLCLRAPLAGAATALLALAWTMLHIGEIHEFAQLTGPLWALPVLAILLGTGWVWRSIGLLNIVFLTIIVWVSWTVSEAVLDDIFTEDDFRIAFILAGFWGVIALVLELVTRRSDLFALRTAAGWASWAGMGFILVGLATERALDGPYIMFIAAAALAGFAGLTAYGAAPGRRWLRGAGVFGFIGAAITIFTYSTNLVTAGLTLIVFGSALVALLIVTNKMLAKAQGQAQ